MGGSWAKNDQEILPKSSPGRPPDNTRKISQIRNGAAEILVWEKPLPRS